MNNLRLLEMASQSKQGDQPAMDLQTDGLGLTEHGKILSTLLVQGICSGVLCCLIPDDAIEFLSIHPS